VVFTHYLHRPHNFYPYIIDALNSKYWLLLIPIIERQSKFGRVWIKWKKKEKKEEEEEEQILNFFM
jgi:hypothetical protein